MYFELKSFRYNFVTEKMFNVFTQEQHVQLERRAIKFVHNLRKD